MENYKEQIVEMVQELDSEKQLKYIYILLKEMTDRKE